MSDDLAGKSIDGLFRSELERNPSKQAVARVGDSSTHWYDWKALHAEVDRLAVIGSRRRYEDLAREAVAVTPFDKLLVELAGRRLKHCRFLSSARRNDVWLNDLAAVVETAGTSGEPRGVMLTEHNLLSNAIALSEASGGDGDELRLSFLPMEHLYARTCDLYTWIVRGSRLVLAESPKTVFRDAKIVPADGHQRRALLLRQGNRLSRQRGRLA